MDEDTDMEFAREVFRPAEGEDLRCYIVDEDGNEIPMRVTTVVIIIQ